MIISEAESLKRALKIYQTDRLPEEQKIIDKAAHCWLLELETIKVKEQWQ